MFQFSNSYDRVQKFLENAYFSIFLSDKLTVLPPPPPPISMLKITISVFQKFVRSEKINIVKGEGEIDEGSAWKQFPKHFFHTIVAKLTG